MRTALILLATAQAPSADAQTTPPIAGTEPRATAAFRSGDIRIDGRVDDAAWLQATAITEFVQGEPVEGAEPQERTEVRVLYDAGAFYVSARLYDRDPSSIATQVVRRDAGGQYDYFEVSLDPNYDRRTGYRFRVGASGVQQDVYLYDDVEEDEAWDAVWESAVTRDSAGWSVEIRIPLSQLRYDASDQAQRWGVNFARRRVASNEITYFALESRIGHGRVSVFGNLDGLLLPSGARRLEIRPYALARNHLAPADAGDPFFDGSRVGGAAGVDVRYGLGANFTLDLTVNPDFGQVEVDPAVINLTAFETFFPEKRPFFVEDAQIFDFSLSGRQNTLFYSRRIGREPRGGEPDGFDYADIPGETTILGAAKLTGRSPGGLSIGALTAVTARESGRAFSGTTGQTVSFEAEPRTEYGVVRVLQDFRDGASQIGAIATLLHRELPGDGTFDFMISNAYGLGVDFEHNWGGSRSRDWALFGFFGTSLISGEPEALIDIQESSNHYFQRPDATRFAVDSTATSLGGRNWRLQFERRSARHWTGAVWIAEVSPGFHINDFGFFNSGERLDGGARIAYRNITPGRLFRSYRFSMFTFHNFRHEALDDAFSFSNWRRAHKSGSITLNANLEFLNYWNLEFSGRLRPRLMSDVATRGGPLMAVPPTRELRLELNTDRRQTLRADVRFEHINHGAGGTQWEGELELGVRPAANVEIQLKPRLSIQTDRGQYVTQTDDVGFAPTFGRRYLFGDLERRSASLETRMNFAFTPNLTFQVFAQPLISSGAYAAYKQLAAPETFDFDTFEPGTAVDAGGTVSCTGGRICELNGEQYVDPDGDGTTDFSFDDENFNVRSLRLSAVLRWEYQPGSRVFLVWQHQRRDDASIGTFDVSRDLDALFGAPAENVFIVKVSYWIGL